MSDHMAGPSLPPGYIKGASEDSSDDSDSSDQTSSETEQTKESCIGPVMPPGFRKRKLSDGEDAEQVYGPVIPSDIKKQKASGPEGPALPPGYKEATSESEESDDDVIGPLPSGGDTIDRGAAAEFEERAERMKQNLLKKPSDEIKKRETWMTELPDKLGTSLGMPVAKTRFGDGKKKVDHAGWTQTPQDKEKRSQGAGHAEEQEDFQYIPTERDQEMAAAVHDFNEKKRPESLLEMHQKKLSKKKKKKERKEKKEKKKKKKDKKSKKEKQKTERKPFDRDRDLQANVFDDAKKKALIKRSQQLNSRFTNSGVQGQFL